MFSQAVMYELLENKGIKDALASSKKLTKGNKHNIFYVMAGIGIPIGVVDIIFNALFKRFLPADSVLSVNLINILTFGLGCILNYALWKALKTLSISK